MNLIGKPERHTQNRVIALFRDELKYRYLGDWTDRANSNIDDAQAGGELVQAGGNVIHPGFLQASSQRQRHARPSGAWRARRGDWRGSPPGGGG